MKKKRLMSAVALLTAVSMMSATVFAAGPAGDSENVTAGARAAEGWQEDSNGWWYIDEYGEYPKDCVRYIHGKKYLFDKSGYLTSGWYYKDTGDYQSGWYYFKDNCEMACNEWITVSGKDYYFDFGGRMETLRVIDGYYLCASGNADKTPGWKCDNKEYDPYWYYVNDDGRADNSGWTEIDGKTYYFDEYSHYIYTNRIIDGFFVDANGVKDEKPGWKSKPDFNNSTTWYYYKNDGTFASGWTEINGKTYYFNEREYYMKVGNKDGYYLNESGAWDTTPGWKTYNRQDTWCYVGGDGKLVEGWKKINGVYYYFDPYMRKNTVLDDKYYINKNGEWDTSQGWKSFNVTIISEHEIPEKFWYYVDDNGNAGHQGWKVIDGVYYYFDYNYVTPRTVVDGYYLGASGAWDKTPGWKNYYNEGWLYVCNDGRAVVNRWEKINGYYYYFNDEGFMQSGHVVDNYYLNTSGQWDTKPGWKHGHNYWYYVNNNGEVEKDCWKEIGKYYYHFNENGELNTNTTVDDYYVDENGVRRL